MNIDEDDLRRIIREELAVMIRDRIEAEFRRFQPRPRCTYPGCTIVDPPNGGHGHVGWVESRDGGRGGCGGIEFPQS